MTPQDYKREMEKLEQSEAYKNMTPIQKALALARLNAAWLKDGEAA